MAAAARKPKNNTAKGAAAGVTLRHPRAVVAVRALAAVVVKVTLADGGVELRRGDDVLATPRAPRGGREGKRRRSDESRVMSDEVQGVPLVTRDSSLVPSSSHHREPGSDCHVPRQQDVFLTCGDPAGTLPCTCIFDRAHSARDGEGKFLPSGVRGPGRRGSGGARPRAGLASLARRYPPALLDGAGRSIDAVEDALFEREQWLAELGVAGYGVAERDGDGRTGRAVLDRWFSGISKDGVRMMLRKKGLSGTMRGVGGRGAE